MNLRGDFDIFHRLKIQRLYWLGHVVSTMKVFDVVHIVEAEEEICLYSIGKAS